MLKNLLVLALVTSCAPAYAQTTVTIEVVTGEDHIAEVTYFNDLETGRGEVSTYTVELDGEVIVFEVDPLLENCGQPTCPDTINVIELPPLFDIEPRSLTVEERQWGKFYIYERLMG